MIRALLKIFIISVFMGAILFAYFIYNKKANKEYIPPVTSNGITNDTPIAVDQNPLPIIANGTISENKTKTDEKLTAPTTTNSISKQQLTEIDNTEIDTRTASQKPKPCTTPIAYTLGTFDQRFSISKSYFLQTISNASQLWSDAVDKNLFVYSPSNDKSTITINLIYDERQQNTDNNKLLGAEIKNSKDSALELQKEYEAMKETFSERKDEYTQKLDTFNARQKTYSDNVAYWNEKGGAPRAEYDALTLERDELQKQNDILNIEHEALTKLLEDINKKISKYNEIVEFSNEKVNVNNGIAQKKFKEGNYSPSNNSITIYQFADEIKLKRVLAHELGHALGIDHLKNKQSIMYAINSSTSTVLSHEDTEAIQAICNEN